MNTDSEQAAGAEQSVTPAGDVPNEVPVVSVASSVPPPAQEPEPEKTETKDSAEPLPQHEWQEKREKEKAVEAEKKQELSLKEEIEELKHQNVRKDWELENPIVKDEKYRDDWARIVSEKGELLKSGKLTYDEAFKLISREDTTSIRRDLAGAQRAQEASVPQGSRSSPAPQGIDPAALEMGRFWGNTQKDFEKYGVR